MITSLLWGGAIESFKILQQSEDYGTIAEAFFVSGDAAKAFYDATPNGLRVKKGGNIHDVMIDMGKEPDVIGSQLQEWLDKGATRCVKAIGVDAGWGTAGLVRLAEGSKKITRKVEQILEGNTPAGVRFFVFK